MCKVEILQDINEMPKRISRGRFVPRQPILSQEQVHSYVNRLAVASSLSGSGRHEQGVDAMQMRVGYLSEGKCEAYRTGMVTFFLSSV